MKASFRPTTWPDQNTEWIGVLIAGTQECDLIPMGTAFLCAPYVALTARHVIDEIFLQFNPDRRLPDKATGDLPFGVQLGLLFGETTVKWDVVSYGYSGSIDIAALILSPPDELPEGFRWNLPTFEVLPPRVGETVSSIGYPKSQHHLEKGGEAKIRINPHRSEGTVIEVHYERRDKTMLHFPCLHTDARFDGGMSGGPVFNAQGNICGLISTNMPPETPDGEHTSYVSLIWPVLGLGLTVIPEPPRNTTERYHIKKLADEGKMKVLNTACFTVADGEGEDHLFLTPPDLGR